MTYCICSTNVRSSYPICRLVTTMRAVNADNTTPAEGFSRRGFPTCLISTDIEKNQ